MPNRPALPIPADLRSTAIRSELDEFVVLSFPVPRWSLPSGLTEAESEVVRAVLCGANREQVAQERGTSLSTVSNLLASAFRKLSVGSKMELAAKLSASAREP
jgi:DNA-binding NarL/FixJ family response regulator